MNGRVDGEELVTFLPVNIRSLLPLDTTMTDKERIVFLKRTIGEKALIEALVDNFFVLGNAGDDHAVKSWKRLGLNPGKRTEIGLALQNLLDTVDREVEELDIEMLEAFITICNIKCSLKHNNSTLSEPVYSTNVT
jgi:predicted lipid carrier protein YhbT